MANNIRSTSCYTLLGILRTTSAAPNFKNIPKNYIGLQWHLDFTVSRLKIIGRQGLAVGRCVNMT